MTKSTLLQLLVNPFERVAGYQALGWGLLGIAVSTLLGYFSGMHCHGLLHYGPAPNNLWWCYAAERLVIWLVPATLFYLGGIIFSKSRIRPVDIWGTTAFSELLFIPMTLFYFLPPVKTLIASVADLPAVLSTPGMLAGIWLLLVSTVFAIWCAVWLFQALKVSANLKGWRIGVVYVLAVFGGDALCRYLIGMLYTHTF